MAEYILIAFKITFYLAAFLVLSTGAYAGCSYLWEKERYLQAIAFGLLMTLIIMTGIVWTLQAARRGL